MSEQIEDSRVPVPPQVALEEAYGLAEFHRLRALRLAVKLHEVRQELQELRETNEALAAEVGMIKEEINEGLHGPSDTAAAGEAA